jgi:NAD(P)-dependent dehydrogenase (short-subunit alcohol dehydrogenase family)
VRGALDMGDGTTERRKEEPMGALDSKVAVVTGAGHGQGRSHAIGLAREGADVVVCDIAAPVEGVPYPMATADELDETVRLVEKEGGRALGVVADMRRTEQVQTVVDRAVSEFGRIDVLVANQGVINYATVENMTDEMWETVLSTNLSATFKAIRAVIPVMKRNRFGRIVATSSMGARQPHPNLAHYIASKTGVIGLVKSCAQEVADFGITVNAVCPGAVATNLFLNDATFRLFCPDIADPTVDDFERRLVENRRGINATAYLQPEQVTRAVLYFVTDLDGVMSGQVTEVGLGDMARIY